MSAPQSPKKTFNLFRDEIYGSLREMESNFKSRFTELESSLKNELENLKNKINLVTADNNELRELFVPYKLKMDKIPELENFKNKANDMLITHEVRIKNNFEEIRKSQLRYDKLISENLYVPGFIGNACQFKTLSDYLSYNINEVSKIKLDKEQMRKDFKELKTKQDNMMKSMVTLNDSTVQICNTYTDGKNSDIKRILKQSLDELNQRSVEMRAMIHQFADNAKKIEEKNKEELEKIIEIKNGIKDEISETKKFNDDINKKIKENCNEMNTNKRKMESLAEQVKEMNKNINNINIKIRNNTNNTSNIMNSRNKINLTNSVSPMRNKKFKTIIDINLSNKSSKFINTSLKDDNISNFNKSKNKSISDLDSVITENSVQDDNQKQTKDMQVNTANNEMIELKEMNNYKNKNLNTISNTNDINKNVNKTRQNNDSMNNTNTNSFNIHSIQNTKGRIKNESNFNNNKGILLPSILKKKEINGTTLFNEESQKINDNNLSPRTSHKLSMEQYDTNSHLKIKSTKIIFQLDTINNEENNNANIDKKKKIDKIHLINDKNFFNNDNDNFQPKKAKFNHRKEILIKRESDTSKQKEKDKQGLKLVSLNLPKNESDINKNKNLKEEVSSTIDNYRANAFTNVKNYNENNNINNEEMLDFPRRVKQAFGRTTYNFLSKNDIINHINANKNINNFELMNNKNKK